MYRVVDADNVSAMSRLISWICCCRYKHVTIAGPSGILPANGAKPDAYVIRGSAGQTLSQTLDVLNNDVGGQLSIIDATPLPDIATLKGSVQINADKKSITYTLNQYNGVPFVEAFRYKVRDATLDLGAVGAITSARVDISVGKYGARLLDTARHSDSVFCMSSASSAQGENFRTVNGRKSGSGFSSSSAAGGQQVWIHRTRTCNSPWLKVRHSECSQKKRDYTGLHASNAQGFPCHTAVCFACCSDALRSTALHSVQ
jgi:hypothetical protein